MRKSGQASDRRNANYRTDVLRSDRCDYDPRLRDEKEGHTQTGGGREGEQVSIQTTIQV